MEFAAEVRKYSRDGKVLYWHLSSLVGEKNKISGLTFYFSVIGAISDFSVDGDMAVHHWWSKLNLPQRVFTNITTTITIAIIVIIDNFCFTPSQLSLLLLILYLFFTSNQRRIIGSFFRLSFHSWKVLRN